MKILKNKEKHADFTISTLLEVKSSKRVMAEHYLDAPDPINGVRFYRGGDILDKEKSKWISRDKFLDIKKRYGAPSINDILVSAIGTVGLIKQVDEEDFYFKDGNIIWLKNFGDNVLQTYIKYALKTDIVQSRMQKRVNRGVYDALSIEAFKEIEIPLPNIEEQEKIANLLSERESYLQSIQTLISKMEQRNQYYLNETLKSEGFIKTNLGELCTIKTGKLNANASSEDGKYPFFTCSRKISRIDDYAFDQEAILVAGNGVVGETKYYEGKFNAYQRTYVLGDFKIPAKYIFHYMKAFFQKRIEREVQGGVISYIKIDNIKDFEIHYPEDEKKFNETLEFIESNEKELELVKQLYSKEKQVFQWLCEKLVSGEYKIED